MRLCDEDFYIKYELIMIDGCTRPEVYHIRKLSKEESEQVLCKTPKTAFTKMISSKEGIFSLMNYVNHERHGIDFLICPECLEALKKYHSDYDGQYTCRLCGETYVSCGTSNEQIVIDSLLHTLHGIVPNHPIGISPSMTEQHFCKDGSHGVADFIGFKRSFVNRVS